MGAPIRAESSAKAAAEVLPEEQQDQAWLKAFFQSKGNGDPAAGIYYSTVDLCYLLPLQGGAIERWEYDRAIKTIEQPLYEEGK